LAGSAEAAQVIRDVASATVVRRIILIKVKPSLCGKWDGG